MQWTIVITYDASEATVIGPFDTHQAVMDFAEKYHDLLELYGGYDIGETITPAEWERLEKEQVAP